jgi:hypothetical protein
LGLPFLRDVASKIVVVAIVQSVFAVLRTLTALVDVLIAVQIPALAMPKSKNKKKRLGI